MEDWLTEHKIPLGAWHEGAASTSSTHHAAGLLRLHHRSALGSMIDGLTQRSSARPAAAPDRACSPSVAWFLQRSLAARRSSSSLALLLIINLGYWEATVETLALVLCATLVCVLIGVPLGIAAAHRPWLYTASGRSST